MKFENTGVWGFEHAIRGMRNPKNSWSKSDSDYCNNDFCTSCPDQDKCAYEHRNSIGDFATERKRYRNKEYIIGEKDMKLMQTLIKAGSEHRKFMRQIFVSVDITAPLFWWKEFDTYKVATVRNSCSTMHTIHIKSFEKDDFTHVGIDEVGEITQKTLGNVIETLEYCRVQFNQTKDDTERKKYWRAIIELLPDGYNMRATVTLNYENLLGMCSKGQRRCHKLNEWSGLDHPDLPHFIQWARSLPYAEDLIFIDELINKKEGKDCDVN